METYKLSNKQPISHSIEDFDHSNNGMLNLLFLLKSLKGRLPLPTTSTFSLGNSTKQLVSTSKLELPVSFRLVPFYQEKHHPTETSSAQVFWPRTINTCSRSESIQVSMDTTTPSYRKIPSPCHMTSLTRQRTTSGVSDIPLRRKRSQDRALRTPHRKRTECSRCKWIDQTVC